MYRFIRHFIYEWSNYPQMIAWRNAHFTDEQIKEMEKKDLKRGIKPYKNRFDYAFRNSKIYYLHRDRYGRKCKKYGGNCDICDAKHC